MSSTVLTLRPKEVVLLDAGEGTAGQLARHYGQSGLGYFYRQLTFIFISHMHADHHAGLAAVLAARAVALDPTANPHLDADALAKTLYIACPRGVTTYIRDLAALHALKLDDERAPVIFIDNECFTAERLTTSRLGDKDLAAFREALDIKWVQTVHVEHRTRAYGLVLIGKKGWKVVYVVKSVPQALRLITPLIPDIRATPNRAKRWSEQGTARRCSSTKPQSRMISQKWRPEKVGL